MVAVRVTLYAVLAATFGKVWLTFWPEDVPVPSPKFQDQEVGDICSISVMERSSIPQWFLSSKLV